ncbi:MAG: PD-(D/E)XK nuclease family protein [Terricaulis sp.]|nr:PD-(D/E)XK nuclease family protein [Terricaulis sp.]
MTLSAWRPARLSAARPCTPRSKRFGDGACHETLLRFLDEELKRHGIAPERRAAERERMALSVSALIEWFASRTALGVAVHRERYGLLDLGETKLSGVADRIEIGQGHAAIWDFKTGAPASLKQVESGLAPQLPLEAAMLKRGVFKDTPKAAATELGYWRFGGKDPTPKALDLDAEGEGEKGARKSGEAAFALCRARSAVSLQAAGAIHQAL